MSVEGDYYTDFDPTSIHITLSPAPKVPTTSVAGAKVVIFALPFLSTWKPGTKDMKPYFYFHAHILDGETIETLDKDTVDTGRRLLVDLEKNTFQDATPSSEDWMKVFYPFVDEQQEMKDIIKSYSTRKHPWTRDEDEKYLYLEGVLSYKMKQEMEKTLKSKFEQMTKGDPRFVLEVSDACSLRELNDTQKREGKEAITQTGCIDYPTLLRGPLEKEGHYYWQLNMKSDAPTHLRFFDDYFLMERDYDF